MSERADEFFAAIKPFAPVGRTVRVSLLNANRGDAWPMVALRLMLSPSAVHATRLYIHFDEFFAIDADNRDCFVPG